MKLVWGLRPKFSFLMSLVYLTVISGGFFVAGAIGNHSIELWYLLWNLFLAWVPVLLTLWLVNVIREKPWSSWQGLTLTFLWLSFLPNSFYLVSDLIHLQDYQRVDIVYDTIMFSSFSLTGLLLGYTSLYLVHKELIKRVMAKTAWIWAGIVLLLCSFAIYLGRDLHWNTWDVLVNPGGILFDVSDIIIHPSLHYLAFTTTLAFFVFLSSMYVVAWQLKRES
jgi:uncharacterized membrane protein